MHWAHLNILDFMGYDKPKSVSRLSVPLSEIKRIWHFISDKEPTYTILLADTERQLEIDKETYDAIMTVIYEGKSKGP